MSTEERSAPVAPQPEPSATELSPMRSFLAIAVGYAAIYFLRSLAVSMLARWFPGDLPQDDSMPTALGFALVLGAELPNALVAGLLVGRLAGRAPLVHTAILAAVLGAFALLTARQAEGIPGWFVAGFALVPPLGALAGGAIAQLAIRRRRQREAAKSET